MAAASHRSRLIDELAQFLASAPSREQLLEYRPSTDVQDWARELLDKQNEGTISQEEQQELNQFEHFERLMRLVKARLRLAQVHQP
jgi:hypothetical protein